MKIVNLSKTYKTKYDVVNALKNVSVSLDNKGMVFIVGVSGSGKSTLLNILAGVDYPTEGSVLIANKDLGSFSESEKAAYRNSYIGMVFQDYNLIEEMSVYENIRFPLRLSEKKFTENEVAKKVEDAIKLVDIEAIKDSRVTEISTGQKQRVAIARAIVKESKVILADEPTGNLDSNNEKIVFDLLKKISKDRLVIVITHNHESAVSYADRILEIEEGEIVSDSSKDAPIKPESEIKLVKPKYNLLNQIVETTNFIRHHLIRFFSMLLVSLMIPCLGVVITSFVFFNVGKSYAKYQEKYESKYVSVSYEKRGKLNYFPITKATKPDEEDADYFEILKKKYPKATFWRQYDIYYKLSEKTSDPIFPNFISSIIVDEKPDLLDDGGRMPEKKNEILITDFVKESFLFHKNKVIKNINIYGVDFKIVGTIKTTHKKNWEIDVNDRYNNAAFKESMPFINSFVFTSESYKYLFNNLKYYYENVDAEIFYASPRKRVQIENVKITTEHPVIINGINLNEDASRDIVISKNLWERAVKGDLSKFQSGLQNGFKCVSKSQYTFKGSISGITSDTEPIIYLTREEFKRKLNLIKGSRAIIKTNDPMYNKVLKNEAIGNEMFQYAKITKEKFASTKVLMIEILVIMALVTVFYFFLMNRLTLLKEKKKIGIKYSFGLDKTRIIIPYLLEALFYALISIGFFVLFIKVLFPIILKTMIFSKDELDALNFYYVGFDSISLWLGFSYGIMLFSMLSLILPILKKTPIEIIKDL